MHCDRALVAGSALLFASSALVTGIWCSSMADMGGMTMPGGWTMSMMWMRMPDQTWLGAAFTFICMWQIMMIAMMLPSLLPMLYRYRERTAASPHLATRTAGVALGYFSVWLTVGIAAYGFGMAIATATMESAALARAVPFAVGAIVVCAGALQFTAWKARHLACCRGSRGHGKPSHRVEESAWRHGARLGVHCVYCCAGLTSVLLVVGVMDLAAMTLVAAAITLERLTPAGERTAWAIGVVVIMTGIYMLGDAIH